MNTKKKATHKTFKEPQANKAKDVPHTASLLGTIPSLGKSCKGGICFMPSLTPRSLATKTNGQH